MADFPIVFSTLPSGLEPMSLFDQAFIYARTGAYFLPNGVLPAGQTIETFGDATHSARVSVGPAGTILAISQVPIAGIGGGNTVIVTGNGPFAVADDTAILVLNRVVGGDTVVNLGLVASRGGVGLTIVDWAGNAGFVTVNPHAGETIMGLATAGVVSRAQGVGTAALLSLAPNEDLSGWLQQ